jgi:hypothetical protein
VPQRPIRSLAVVGVLALGDYLLWNWSLGANHDVVALVAGMTLIPLLIALAWLVVVAIARLLARATQLPKVGASTRSGGSTRPSGDARAGRRSRRSPVGVAAAEAHPTVADPATVAARTAPAASPSSKLAA